MGETSKRWGAALICGLAWGVGLPTAAGVCFALAGAVAAALAVAGDPRRDAARGLLAGVCAWGLALAWVPGAWARFAGQGGWGIWAVAAALGGLQCAALLGAWSAAMGPPAGQAGSRRAGGTPAPRQGGTASPLAAGVAGVAVTGIAAALQPLPADPGLLLAGAPILLGPAAIGGRPLLVGVLLAWGALAARRPLVGVAALGTWALLALAVPTGGPTTAVGVVQPGTGAFDGRRASTAPERAAKLRGLVRAAAADWVATPESSWPGGDPPGGNLVLGRTGRDNALVVLEDGVQTDRFAKQRLVPLAEADLVPGTGPRLLEIAGIRVGPLVCYEDLFPSAVRAADRAGAQVLLAATNDAWIGPGRPGLQHLAAARLAAVTTGRWVVRPTTSGTSAVIDPRGRLAWSAGWVDGDVHPEQPGRWTVAQVPLRTPPWTGAAAAPWLTALAACAWLLLLTRSRRAGETPAPRPGF